MTKYTKPHLTFSHQVQHLIDRGLTCGDLPAAEYVLQKLGYYRFSAYAYPFRVLLPETIPRETSVQYRSDEFAVGASFELVSSLAALDRKLRMLCLDALEAVELELRVQVAYVLGTRDPFGHLNLESLDTDTCNSRVDDEGPTRHEMWRARYSKLQTDASEDFLTHYVEKYEGQLPIWVAIEVLDFGSLVRLFGLLKQTDQTTISRAMGIPAGKFFARSLTSLNYLRNVCAHHSRLWNRSLTYQIPTVPLGMIPTLDHLAGRTQSDRRKVYSSLALLAHMTSHGHSTLDWAARVRELLESFPVNGTVSPEGDMGFPDDWFDHEIWART